MGYLPIIGLELRRRWAPLRSATNTIEGVCMADAIEDKLFDSSGLRGAVSVEQEENVDSTVQRLPALASPTIERFNAGISGAEWELPVFSISVTEESMEDKASLFDELLCQRIAKVKRVSADVSKQLRALK